MKPKIIKTYQCPICEKIHDTTTEAEECIAQGVPEPIVQVGDIVQLGFGYGWYDGKREWVINPEIIEVKNIGTNLGVAKNYWMKRNHGDDRRVTNCFGRCCTMGFYYVVTKIEIPTDEDYGCHRVRYHVFTKAMTGDKGHIGGYTHEGTHITPVKIENVPEFVVKDSKDIIGKEAKYLL